MPKLEYPAKFEGLNGVKCKLDIYNREAFLFIPYRIMLTESKIISNLDLKEIFAKEYKSLKKFKYGILTLGLLYEISKNEKSFWHPYICEIMKTKSQKRWT